MKNLWKYLEEGLFWGMTALFFFFVGYFYTHPKTPEIKEGSSVSISVPTKQKVSVTVSHIEGDRLCLQASSPLTLHWGAQRFALQDAPQCLPLGAIPRDNERLFFHFPYVGNAKTKKFYPSNTYPARGTAFSARRFFPSKEAAIKAGFIPSKLVK